MFNTDFIRVSIGTVVFVIGSLFLIPALMSIIFAEGHTLKYFIASITLLIIGLFIRYKKKLQKGFKFRIYDLFVTTSIIWIIVSVLCSLPYLLVLDVNFYSALFESVSGVTTTGATVLSHLEDMPRSIILWRSITQWLGGIGFIAISVLILPNINAGGMRLFKTESSDISDKAFPHDYDIFRKIFYFYLGATFSCFILYLITGMDLWHAINMTLTTVSTGGFAPTDQGFALYNDANRYVGMFFMFFLSLPMILIISALYKKKYSLVFMDSQVRFFFYLIMVLVLILSVWLYFKGIFSDIYSAVHSSLFNVINILSTSGFTYMSFDTWTTFSTTIFIFCFLIGGCSGSTSSGLKVFRLQVLSLFIKKQLLDTVHPRAINHISYNQQSINESSINSIFSFTVIYFIVFFISAVIISMSGQDLLTSFSSSLSALSNIGPALGPVVGPDSNFSSLDDFIKLLLSVEMVLGRLEMMTILVLLLPKFWKY